MANSSWVCCECRLAVRWPTQHLGDVPCSACGVACWPLGYKTPVPPKRDVEAWRNLLAAETEKKQQRATKATESQVRSRHALEQEIGRLVAMPENVGRASAIRALQRRLSGE
jgi:hypothetical protein